MQLFNKQNRWAVDTVPLLLSQDHPGRLRDSKWLPMAIRTPIGQPITVPKLSGRPWDSQLLSQSHPDAHGTVNFTAQSHPDARGMVHHTFGTAVGDHRNADGYGPDACGTQTLVYQQPLAMWHLCQNIILKRNCTSKINLPNTCPLCRGHICKQLHVLYFPSSDVTNEISHNSIAIWRHNCYPQFIDCMIRH